MAGRPRRRLLLVIAAVCAGVLLLARPGAGDSDPAAPTPPGERDPAAMVPAVPPADRAEEPGGRPPAATPDPDAPQVSPPPPVLEPHHHDDLAAQETLPPAEAAEAIAVAERFAELWASPAPDWHERLAPLATEALAGSLAVADPPQPPPEFTGAAQLHYEAPAWARVGVPARHGTLVLDVLRVDGGWLVSAVDWELA